MDLLKHRMYKTQSNKTQQSINLETNTKRKMKKSTQSVFGQDNEPWTLGD